MSIQKPTIEEHNKLVEAALIDDGDYSKLNDILQCSHSKEELIVSLIKSALIDKHFDDNIVRMLVESIESDIPYLLNEIETASALDFLTPLNKVLTELYKKGDELVVKRDLEFIDELKDNLSLVSTKKERIKILKHLIINNNDFISRGRKRHGDSYQVGKFFQEQFDLLLLKEEINEDDVLPKPSNALSAFELALRQYYLENSKIEPRFQGRQIVEKYGIKKVEVFLNELRKGMNYQRKGLVANLENVKKELSDYPEVQKAIINDIDKIN